MARLAAHFPDAAVGLASAPRDMVHLAPEGGPHVMQLFSRYLADAAVGVEAVEQLAVDVELKLRGRGVAQALPDASRDSLPDVRGSVR